MTQDGMPAISFTTKEKSVYEVSGAFSHMIIMVPQITRKHCDMNSFRHHVKYGALANSDLFPNALSRIQRDVFKGRDYFRLDDVPDGVTVDGRGFMAKVSIEI